MAARRKRETIPELIDGTDTSHDIVSRHSNDSIAKSEGCHDIRWRKETLHLLDPNHVSDGESTTSRRGDDGRAGGPSAGS
jgi:hypothetical protein